MKIHRTSVERGNVKIDIMCIGDFFDIVEKSFAVFDFVGFFDVFYDSIGPSLFISLIKVVEEQNLQKPQDDHEEGGEQNKIKPCFKCDTAVVQSMLQICSPDSSQGHDIVSVLSKIVPEILDMGVDRSVVSEEVVPQISERSLSLERAMFLFSTR